MNSNKKLIHTFLAMLFLFPVILASGNSVIEETKILETVNKFLLVLETGDTSLAKEILVIEGSNFSIREDEESYKVRFTDYKTLVENLPKKDRESLILLRPKI